MASTITLLLGIILSILFVRIDASLPLSSMIRARCKLLCLQEFGNAKIEESDTVPIRNRTHCDQRCVACAKACEIDNYGENECERSCDGEQQTESECLTGCKLVEQAAVLVTLTNGQEEIDHGNNTSPYRQMGLVCMNLPAEPSNRYVSASFTVDYFADKLPATINGTSEPFIFVYEIRQLMLGFNGQNDTPTAWDRLGMKFERHFTLFRLLPDTTYQLRAFMIGQRGLLWPEPVETSWIKTLSADSSVLPPLSMTISSQEFYNNYSVRAVVEWMPNPVYPSCIYRVSWRTGDTTETKVVLIDNEFKITIEDLSPGKTYSVWISALSSGEHQQIASTHLATVFKTIAIKKEETVAVTSTNNVTYFYAIPAVFAAILFALLIWCLLQSKPKPRDKRLFALRHFLKRIPPEAQQSPA